MVVRLHYQKSHALNFYLSSVFFPHYNNSVGRNSISGMIDVSGMIPAALLGIQEAPHGADGVSRGRVPAECLAGPFLGHLPCSQRTLSRRLILRI